jgi:hypothetical protein
MIKRIVRQALPIGLAIGLLWYVLKDVPLTELTNQFRRADYRWLALTGLLVGLYHLTRAARWQLTLQALGYRPSLFRTTVALLAGTLASLVIPGAGELTRCGTLQRTDGVPLAQGIGSVVAERVIDVLTLVGLIGLTLLLEFDRVGPYIVNLLAPLGERFTTVGQAETFGILVLGAGVAGALLYWLNQKQAIRQHPLTIRLLGIGRGVGKGFMGIRQLRQPSLFVALTLLTEVVLFLITYVLFFASSQTSTLPPVAALTILTVSSVGGLAVPTQGGLGTYHFLVSRVLILYGMNETDGVVVATFLHAVQVGFSLLFSSLSFLIVPVLIRQRSRRTESVLD